MFRKGKIVLLSLLLLVLLPSNSFASSMSGEYLPNSDSDYYQKKISWQLYMSPGIEKLRITQFTYGVPKTVIETVTWNVKPNSTVWVDMTCRGDTSFEFLDANGSMKQVVTRGQTDVRLGAGTCEAGKTIKPSDYNEEKKQYASDTFGGTKPKLDKPSTPDGSGGTGETGYEGEDDGSGGGNDGGTDPGGDDGGGNDGGTDPGDGDPPYEYPEWCDPECRVFECPQWSEYMGKLDDIRQAIPPAPNWPVVADVFRDSIVPKLINDLGNLLGSAPAKPTPPSIPDGINDRGFNNKTPQGQEAPGLGGTDFSKIKDEAPVIPEIPDNSDGFNILNPVDNLPTQEEFLQNIPKDVDAEAPMPTDDGGNAPMPGDEGGTAPLPGDQGGTAPLPDDSGGTAPLPNDGGGNAPIPGGDEGTAPIPGGSGNNAPNPGDWGGTVPIPRQGG